MATHREKNFDGIVNLDGNEYHECHFRQCELRYGGGPLPVLHGCHFYDCKWTLVDAADRTLAFLRSLYHGGLQDLVNATFSNLKAAAMSNSDSPVDDLLELIQDAGTQAGSIIYVPSPRIVFATNTFVNVPIILQYENVPLIEMIQVQSAGFTTQFRIYSDSGDYLAKVKGSQLYVTPDGRKADVKLRYPDKMTVCEIGSRTAFELRRDEAAGLKTSAELFTQDGAFVRFAEDAFPKEMFRGNKPLQLNGCVLAHNLVSGCRIGVLLKANGAVAMGVA